jgi:phosphatidylglycerophosphate synthase
MNKPTVKEIKEISIRDRYFPQDTWWDHIFSPLSPYIAWVFIRLNISGNGVSWISGFSAIIGAILIASESPKLIFIGSFGYILFFQLDYVDGAVARFNKKSGISGQYVDWIMHVISHVAIVSGIAIGALGAAGSWLYPFVILGIIASCLVNAKYSMAWFAICMEQQQRRAKGVDVNMERDLTPPINLNWSVFNYMRKLSILIFHENYLIFWLPIVACLQFFELTGSYDLRILFTLVAAMLCFPVQILEIHRMVIEKRIENGYNSLFSSDEIPKLPEDHFFN